MCEGIVEEVDMLVSGKEFYIFYKVVVRENVELIKMWVVYDVLVKVYIFVFLLNDCLEVGLLF